MVRKVRSGGPLVFVSEGDEWRLFTAIIPSTEIFAKTSQLMSADVREFLGTINEQTKTHFPLSCDLVLLVNLPYGFEGTWNALAPYIAPTEVVARVKLFQLVGDVFEKYVAKDQVPVALGGTFSDHKWLNMEHESHPWNRPAFLERLRKEGHLKLWEEVHAGFDSLKNSSDKDPAG